MPPAVSTSFVHMALPHSGLVDANDCIRHGDEAQSRLKLRRYTSQEWTIQPFEERKPMAMAVYNALPLGLTFSFSSCVNTTFV